MPETVNTIFRVAHSIKGGAGMFGFNEVTSFTHTLETLLDELRGGRMEVTAPICEGLLQSVDQIRGMLTSVQKHQPFDPAIANTLKGQIHAPDRRAQVHRHGPRRNPRRAGPPRRPRRPRQTPPWPPPHRRQTLPATGAAGRSASRDFRTC